MYRFDDRFLQSVGLSEMSDDQKETFLDYAQEQFEIKVGEAISSVMNEAQLEEFDKITDADPAIVQGWLARYANYEEDVEYRNILKRSADEEEAKLSFVTKKWLDVNCPSYDKMIEETMVSLQKEIYNQRESILAGAQL